MDLCDTLNVSRSGRSDDFVQTILGSGHDEYADASHHPFKCLLLLLADRMSYTSMMLRTMYRDGGFRRVEPRV